MKEDFLEKEEDQVQQVLLELKVNKVLLDRMELRVQQEKKEQKVILVQLGYKAAKVREENQDHLAIKEIEVIMEHQVQKVLLEDQESKDLKVL